MGCNPVVNGGDFRRCQSQSELGSPPHDVLGGASPFLRHQVPDFGLRQAGAEPPAEIAFGFRVAKDLAGARAVGVRQPVGVRRGEKRIIADEFRGQGGDRRNIHVAAR